MKRLIIFLTLCLSAIYAMAIAEGDTNYIDYYQKEYNKVFREYTNDPSSITNKLAMSEFYSAENNPMRNLALAMRYLLEAEEKYLALVNDNSQYKEVNKLIKQKITIASIRKLKTRITDDLYNCIDSEKILFHQCDDYIEIFAFSNQALEALKHYKAELAYRKTEELNTVEAYLEFVNNYANHKRAKQALKKVQDYIIEDIDNADTEEKVDKALKSYINDTIRRYAEKKKGKIAYRTTLKINTVESYKEYLSRYPSSDEYVMALERIDGLLYDKFVTLSTPSEYAAFAMSYSDSQLSEQAVDSIVVMILNDRSIEALDVYLKNFTMDYRYNDVFQTYYRWHTVEGGVAPIEYFATEYPNYPFLYSLSTDLENSRKIDEMNLMVDFEEKNLREYTDFIKQNMTVGVAYVALQRMVQDMIKKKRWNDAVRRLQSVSICFEDNNVKNYNDLLTILKDSGDKNLKLESTFSPKFEVKNVAVTSDGTTMYYTQQDVFGGVTRIAKAKNVKGRWAEDNTDVVFGNIDNKGLAVFSLFDDDTKMLIGKDENIAIAELDVVTKQWMLTSIMPYPINTDAYDGDAFMLPDDSGILFVSDRRGGLNLQPSKAYFHGDTALASDIYFVPRKQVYGWGDAINLGPAINTIYSERSPVMSKDMKTIYFVSDGHGGLGYLDVYKSTRPSADSWNNWSEPMNIGKVVNTGFSELSLALSQNEDYLYVITDRNGKYEMLEMSLNNDDNVFEKDMKIYCNNDLQLGSNKASFVVTDLDAGLPKGNYMFSDDERQVEMRLFTGKTYIINSLLHGYYSPICVLNEYSLDNVEMVYHNIDVLKTNKTTLPLVLVDYLGKNSVMLVDKSYYELNNIADFMKNNPNYTVEIISNVDIDDVEKAYNLSQSRSHAIKNYLVSIGVDKDRVIASGFANTAYLSESDTIYQTEIRIW
ncbi:MAG: PD40 domain-containing protein [Bacteroidales bacterium]|nr:PD40 domain-containing protein [Bacteroidales bacterium]